MNAFQKKISSAKNFVEKHEKYLIPAFFVGGLILDNLTLRRIDQLFDNIVLLSYLLIATLCIVLINFFQSKEIENRWTSFLPLITQFAFGGLFSGYIIFYTKSASITTSWIFLLIIYAIFLGNDKFREYYKKIDFQINLLFIALFSYLIFFIPVVLKTMGDLIFLLSGLISLAVIYVLMTFFFRYVSSLGARRAKKMVRNILSIYVIFNLMYFLNIIPPVPLSLKHLEVYNYVEKSFDGNYLARKEKKSLYKSLQFWNDEFNKASNGAVYIYASVFAPTDLNTEITHLWQRYNNKKGEWVTLNEVVYPIAGGRGEGYRGYSVMNNAIPGDWRVYIKNKQGQTLGKIKFEVREGEDVEMETEQL